jgi:cyclic-di-GMP phosphodiesterase TipF (flagellum assembly factor)
MPAIDSLMFARCVRIVRRLQSKNRDVGVICGLSVATLTAPDVFASFADFAEANRVVGPALAFTLPYATLRTMGAREEENLARLTDLGFRLAIDHVFDLRFDARELADRKCGFLKIPAGVLLDRAIQATANIHSADLAGLLARYGVELIADGVVSESTVVDLLDFELKFAQGDLFSPPRPARPEATQLGDERDDTEVRAPTSTALPAASPLAPARAAPPLAERAPAMAKLARGAGRA